VVEKLRSRDRSTENPPFWEDTVGGVGRPLFQQADMLDDVSLFGKLDRLDKPSSHICTPLISTTTSSTILEHGKERAIGYSSDSLQNTVEYAGGPYYTW
jgi:hypothetical protein